MRQPEITHALIDLLSPIIARQFWESTEIDLVLGRVKGDVGVGVEGDSVCAREETLPGGDAVETVVCAERYDKTRDEKRGRRYGRRGRR